MDFTRPRLLATLALLTTTPLVSYAQDAAPVANAPAPTSTLKAYDPKAEALLQRAADRIQARQSLFAQEESIVAIPATEDMPASKRRSFGPVYAQKPNFVRSDYTAKQQGSDGKWTVADTSRRVSDGKKLFAINHTTKSYMRLPLTGESLAMTTVSLDFFGAWQYGMKYVRDAKANGLLVSLMMAPDAVRGDTLCFVVEQKNLPGQNAHGFPPPILLRTYIGKKDGIIRGYHAEWPGEDSKPGMVVDDSITKLAFDKKLSPSTFAVDLTGYKNEVEPKPLLAEGTLAPDFTVADKDGKPVKLSDFRGKIVVLDFWATWCVPCIASMPHTTEVAKKMADKGVVVLAVNVWDKQDAFDTWLPKHPEFSTLTFAIDSTPSREQSVASKLYKVSGIPAQYVIGRDGKITAAFGGYYGPSDDLKEAIAKADSKADASPQK